MRMPSQAGLSLVEILVALAIGLFLVLIATTIYMQGLSSFGFRVGQSENLGNSRLALAVLDSEFSKAGYRRDPSQAMFDAFPADSSPHPNGCQFAQGQALYAADAQTVCLRFQPRDAAETDCAGTPANLGAAGPYDAPAPATGMFAEKYTVESGVLVCRAAQEVVPLADGVRAVHFEFGEEGRGLESEDPAVPGIAAIGQKRLGPGQVGLVQFGPVQPVQHPLQGASGQQGMDPGLMRQDHGGW